jgi:hypothetical protein
VKYASIEAPQKFLHVPQPEFDIPPRTTLQFINNTDNPAWQTEKKAVLPSRQTAQMKDLRQRDKEASSPDR